MPPTSERHPSSTSPSEDRPPARFGVLGLCDLCQRSGASHFDTVGRWVGCTAAQEGQVFVMTVAPPTPPRGATTVPSRPVAAAPAVSRPGKAELSGPRRRRFNRARYFVAPLPEKATVAEVAGPSRHRRTVVQQLLQSRGGLLSREISERTKLPHGSVQQALIWLQAHHIVGAREDDVMP